MISSITTQQLTLGSIILALALMFWSTKKESFTPEEKKTCRSMTKKSEWKKYDWQPRKNTSSGWKCSKGWEDTKCNYGMGKEFERKQCRRLKDTSRGILATAGGGGTCGSNNDCLAAQVCVNGKCETRYSRLDPFGFCTKNSHCGEGGVCRENKCDISSSIDQVAAAGSNTNSTPAPVTTPSSSSWTIPDQAIKDAIKQDGDMAMTTCGKTVTNDWKTRKVLDAILAIPGMSGAFVIVTYLGKKSVATGHSGNYHIECDAYGTNGVEYNFFKEYDTKGYDIYVWAPGAKGTFEHKNKAGYAYWAMNGGKFQDNWKIGQSVSISN